MEKVEGQNGLKIDWKEGEQAKDVPCKALGRVMSERPVYAKGLEASLGKAWCPLRGILYKGMVDNIFLFTFLQESGKQKALKGGPWMVNNNDLIVITNFDPMRTRQEYVFDTVSIWIRIFKLPLGMMNHFIRESIGNPVGEPIGVDVGDDDMAEGEYLRIQVRLNIMKPLMRGIMMKVGKIERDLWCPFEYEYLSEFCFTCGVIGHEARECSIKLKKGEKQ
ncbi:hypothetical protein ACQ4PT_032318 [Festuca glaucescens]